jgi:lipopolysaccharide transport system permease protein
LKKDKLLKNKTIQLDVPFEKRNPTLKPIIFIISIFKSIKNSRELAWRLFIRDLSAQYRQSFLGFFWAFFPPLVTAGIFILLQSKNIITTSSISVPYPAYVLIGTTLWQIFTDSVNAPLKTLTNAKPYIVKIYFPREALILSSFLGVIFNVLVRTIIILGVFIFFKIGIHAGILLAPIGILFLIIIGMLIGIFLTPIGMLYSDISTSLPIVLQLLFFATPVVYNLPNNFPLNLINFINPVTPILIATRNFLINGYTDNLFHFTIIAILSFFGLILSIIVFRKSLPVVIEKLGS